MSSPDPTPPGATAARVTVDADGWASISGLTLRDAEELLDWLEAHGYGEREVVFEPGPGATVRWRR